jgi:hypothetical protein
VIGPGLWFAEPGRTYAELPWNSAVLTGRIVPQFERARRYVIAAAELVPELPVINWDLIITAAGPVILEGNTCGDWILTNFANAPTGEITPLVDLLQRWAARAS